jgi:sigma-B regulation protein RsbU (phosphoserine phosphatase)
MATVSSKLERPRILVADDQTDIILALEVLLRNEGYEVRSATSPAAALEALRGSAFDLVLMDLNYSRKPTSVREGIDLLARIEEIDPLIPVVVMTAWGSIDLAVEAMNIGASNFIQKPWENAKLVELVRGQIEQGRSRRRSESRRTEEKWEIEEAGQIQRAFLPASLPNVDSCEMAVRWQPKGCVGGDYYDVFPLDARRLAFCVADASGKGLPAALLMSNLQAGLRSLADSSAGPAETVTRLNRLFCANRLTNKFFTLFYGVLDLGRFELTYSNAGHPPPVVRHRDGGLSTLQGTGGLVGCFPDWTYREESVHLAPGDRIWLYTDGLSEARAAGGGAFGPARMEKLMDEVQAVSLTEAQGRVWNAVLGFCGGAFEDDATLLTFHLKDA